MKLKVLLIISTIYMGLIGIGHLFAPVAMSMGVVPTDASVELIAFLRHYSALFIAMAVMNWVARNAEASTARNAIVLANIVAFGIAAVLDVVTVLSGAGVAGLVPAFINSVIGTAFFWASRVANQ